MHLYLMRHGSAVEQEDWPGKEFARPLTEEGFAKTEAVVKAVKKKHGLEIGAIWTSPLVRARQTAEIAGKVLKKPVLECEALEPGASVARLAAAFQKTPPPGRVMLVGHEPDCGEMLGELLGEAAPRPFKKAGLAALQGEFKPGGMKLDWQIAPKDVL